MTALWRKRTDVSLPDGPDDGKGGNGADAQPEGRPGGEQPMVRDALPRTTPSRDDDLIGDKGLGWRSSRRGSKAAKQARKQAKAERTKERVAEGTGKVIGATRKALTRLLMAVLLVGAAILGLWLAALGINAFTRWNLIRIAKQSGAEAMADAARDNLLVIGVDDKRAVGFLALKADREGGRALGIAIPDGAFVEVPGQGFERIGDSFDLGADVSKDAVSNYLYVPFKRYATVDADVYQRLIKDQQVSGLLDKVSGTDLRSSERVSLSRFLSGVKAKDVYIVPLPVKPVSVGDQRYYEPQRDEIADLLLGWWNVRLDESRQGVSVMVFNGVGTPGIAGKAAQQLIRSGFRVVDSKNADSFKYQTTQILLYHGTRTDARRVREALGVGAIDVRPDKQDVADIMVIIGADYVPQAKKGK